MTDRRMLLVHAHPDDETINNGATVAAAVVAGVGVTLVTCTRGELGEVLAPDLAHLRGAPDALGAHRERELAVAMAVLGVRDHRFLGADAGVRYRDSGMVTLPGGTAGTPPDLHPEAFAAADLDAAAGHLARVLVEVRPHVLLTYDAGGGYGHPDHVMAYRVAMRAVELAAAGTDGWQVPKVYAAVVPRSLLDPYLASMPPDAAGFGAEGPLPSMIVDDDDVTTVIAAESFRSAKLSALEAHRSQVVVDREAGTATQDDGFAQPVLATEWYQLLHGRVGPPFDGEGRETDLFAGS